MHMTKIHVCTGNELKTMWTWNILYISKRSDWDLQWNSSTLQVNSWLCLTENLKALCVAAQGQILHLFVIVFVRHRYVRLAMMEARTFLHKLFECNFGVIQSSSPKKRCGLLMSWSSLFSSFISPVIQFFTLLEQWMALSTALIWKWLEAWEVPCAEYNIS